MIFVCDLADLSRGAARRFGHRIQCAGHAEPGDEVTVQARDPGDARLLAVDHRSATAVLGVDQPRLFTRRRREPTVSEGAHP